ncbi:hypothetical protein RB213_009714, partial [Colletotrichum asianum]
SPSGWPVAHVLVVCPPAIKASHLAHPHPSTFQEYHGTCNAKRPVLVVG